MECGPGAADCSPGRINAVSVARNVVLGCRLVASNSVPAARLMQSWGPAIAVLYSYGFPRWQGSPVFWARQQDRDRLASDLRHLVQAGGHGMRLADAAMLAHLLD